MKLVGNRLFTFMGSINNSVVSVRWEKESLMKGLFSMVWAEFRGTNKRWCNTLDLITLRRHYHPKASMVKKERIVTRTQRAYL